jgi:hypothetical protein
MSNTGGPAYPTNNYAAIVPISAGYSEGMTIRDYFAGQAMAAVNLGIGVSDEYYRKTAKHCYAVADAMLKEREGK